jgi:hypothetical protein
MNGKRIKLNRNILGQIFEEGIEWEKSRDKLIDGISNISILEINDLGREKGNKSKGIYIQY